MTVVNHTERHRENMLYKIYSDFLCAIGFCTKLLLDLQAWIEVLCIKQQQSSWCAVSHVLRFMQGEVFTRTSLIGYWNWYWYKSVGSTVG